MILAWQHIPNFVDGAIPKKCEVATLVDLLNTPWINNWANIDLRENQPFYRWSFGPISKGSESGYLMAEYGNGKLWWVVATLNKNPGLPTWYHPSTTSA